MVFFVKTLTMFTVFTWTLCERCFLSYRTVFYKFLITWTHYSKTMMPGKRLLCNVYCENGKKRTYLEDQVSTRMRVDSACRCPVQPPWPCVPVHPWSWPEPRSPPRCAAVTWSLSVQTEARAQPGLSLRQQYGRGTRPRTEIKVSRTISSCAQRSPG